MRQEARLAELEAHIRRRPLATYDGGTREDDGTCADPLPPRPNALRQAGADDVEQTDIDKLWASLGYDPSDPVRYEPGQSPLRSDAARRRRRAIAPASRSAPDDESRPQPTAASRPVADEVAALMPSRPTAPRSVGTLLFLAWCCLRSLRARDCDILFRLMPAIICAVALSAIILATLPTRSILERPARADLSCLSMGDLKCSGMR